MLPLAHIYVSKEVTGRKNTLLVFGSILPDIATTSKGDIGREEIHNSPSEFYKFVIKNCPKLKELGLGVKLHSFYGRGADYYSDDYKIGFAVREGKKIVKKIKELLDSDNTRTNQILAHNFIEAGVDLNLNKLHPEILKLYRKTLKDINLDAISTCLGNYLGLEKRNIHKELEYFIQFLRPDNFLSSRSITDSIIIPLIKIRFGKEVNPELTKDILDEAVAITKEDYMNYLNSAIKGMKRDFSEII